MTVAIPDIREDVAAEAVQAGVVPGRLDMRSVGRLLRDIVHTSQSGEAALQQTLKLVQALCQSPYVVYFVRDDHGQLVPGPRQHGPQRWPELSDIEPSLLRVAEETCAQGDAQIHRLDTARCAVSLTVPVLCDGDQPEALSAVIEVPGQRSELLAVPLQTLQLFAASIAQWRGQPYVAQARRHSDRVSRLLDVITQAAAAPDLDQGCDTIVQGMRDVLECHQVVLSVRRHGCSCRVRAISGVRQFDRQAEVVRAMESVMEEAILGGALQLWMAGGNVAATDAQKALAEQSGCQVLVSAPLRGLSGEITGAWIVLDDQDQAARPDKVALLQIAETHVGTCLELLQRAEPTTLSRAWTTARELARGQHRRTLIAALVVTLTVLALPLPYQIKCDGVVQPVQRRFVSVPYDGKLEEALVRPGDLVRKGQVVARMDGREIRWELAGLRADYNRATKQHDVGLATHDTATAQMAALEMEQLALKIRLLEERAENLEVKSPIDGIVISGDPQRTEGARMTMGQTILEVAPLDKMVVELDIRDQDIPHAQVGQTVRVRLDGVPWTTYHGTLQAIQPRAELRNGKNIFVGEVPIDNPDGVLRPGSSGRARIRADRHLLAWNLFHGAWERITFRLGW